MALSWFGKRPNVCTAVRRVSADWRGLAPAAPAAAEISVVTPLWNTKPKWLAEAAVSLFDQTSTAWEWCLVDDGSTNVAFEPVLAALMAAYPRIRVQRMATHGGISAASNAGLEMAAGEFVCFLDHDDLLHPEALSKCLQKLRSGQFDAVYTDSDKACEQGIRDEPFRKPDWSPRYFENVMYVGHLLCVRRAEALAAGGFDSRFDGVQDFEFFLRYSERFGRIGHVDEILYHWRRVAGSVAASATAKPGIERLQQTAVAEHLGRLGLRADVAAGAGSHRVRVIPAERRGGWPRISVIQRGQARELNQVVQHDGSEFLMFLGPGVDVGRWEDLLYYCEFSDTGAVGGVDEPWESAREVRDVSVDYMMIRRDVFDAAGGFDENYRDDCFDADLCRRLMKVGRRNIGIVGLQRKRPQHSLDRALLADHWDEPGP